mmetsp:Transcript_41701/g.120454  ORF Transcript_41701/g.120454 Transcript_41701/m.120454 type:complete len:332 (-) Transcript_41701:868-1863(-)
MATSAELGFTVLSCRIITIQAVTIVTKRVQRDRSYQSQKRAGNDHGRIRREVSAHESLDAVLGLLYRSGRERSPCLFRRSRRTNARLTIWRIFFVIGGFSLNSSALSKCKELCNVEVTRVLDIEGPIKNEQNSHGFDLHIIQIGQQFWGDEEVLTTVVRGPIFPRYMGRIGNDTLEDQTFIPLVQSLVDLINASEGRHHHILQSHEIHNCGNRTFSTRLNTRRKNLKVCVSSEAYTDLDTPILEGISFGKTNLAHASHLGHIFSKQRVNLGNCALQGFFPWLTEHVELILLPFFRFVQIRKLSPDNLDRFFVAFVFTNGIVISLDAVDFLG